MGAVAAVSFLLIALVWYGLFILATARENALPAARRAYLLYLLALVLLAWETPASCFPGAGGPVLLLAIAASPLACILFTRAYLAWKLPRPAYDALLAGLLALGLAQYVVVPHPGMAPLAALCALVYGLSLLGLAAWLWIHAWHLLPGAQKGRGRILLMGAAVLALCAALFFVAPEHAFGLELALAAISTALAALIILRRRMPPLPLPQRTSAGYALLGLLAAVFFAALAVAAHDLSATVQGLLVLGAGFVLAGVTLAFPELAGALNLWVERAFLRSRYEARQMVEEVAEAAPAVLDLEPLAGMILERTMQALDIRWGLFALWDRTAGELHAVVARGLAGPAVTARWPREHPLTQWLLRQPGEGVADELPYSRPDAGYGTLDTAWIVPVRLREEPVGVFLYGPHTSGEPYTATECSILNLLANETAAAVANARLFDQVARARREWLQTFDALSDGVLLHDRQGRILRANRALARLVDRPFDQIISRPWFELIPVGPEPRQLCLRPASTGDGHPTAEYDLAYGERRTLHVTVSPLVKGDEFCVHVVRDVTDERALQRQLAQAEKLAAIGQMLSGVAHELNNPLTTIIGFSELLQDASVPEPVRADLQRIYRQAVHSSRIVQGLLTFARHSQLQMAEVDINELVNQTLEFMQPQIDSRHITVTLDLDPALPRTLADAGQLQQVLLNLITNAIQAMEESHDGAALRLRTRTTPTHVQLAVCDNGPGIPPELLQRVFDPFYTTKEVGAGTGLGLSICYGIVREHGGRIWAESDPGHGATFYVELPLRHVGAASGAGGPTRIGRILVVEDDEAIVALFRRVLEPAGHTILSAADGEEGLIVLAEAVARQELPDLVVADLKMPRLDGPAFYERVRVEFPLLTGRFLFIGGDTLGREQARFLEDNGRPCLRKPFGVREIEQAIAQTLAV